MPLPPRLQAFLDELAFFPDRADRIQVLISVAERFTRVPSTVAEPPYDEEFRVPGCESEAYVWVVGSASAVNLYFDVLNPQGVSAMALATILKETLDGEPASAFADVPDEIVFDLFGRELSMGKSLGLMNTVRAVKARARIIGLD